jgi:hypothetical protein
VRGFLPNFLPSPRASLLHADRRLFIRAGVLDRGQQRLHLSGGGSTASPSTSSGAEYNRADTSADRLLTVGGEAFGALLDAAEHRPFHHECSLSLPAQARLGVASDERVGRAISTSESTLAQTRVPVRRPGYTLLDASGSSASDASAIGSSRLRFRAT